MEFHWRVRGPKDLEEIEEIENIQVEFEVGKKVWSRFVAKPPNDAIELEKKIPELLKAELLKDEKKTVKPAHRENSSGAKLAAGTTNGTKEIAGTAPKGNGGGTKPAAEETDHDSAKRVVGTAQKRERSRTRPATKKTTQRKTPAIEPTTTTTTSARTATTNKPKQSTGEQKPKKNVRRSTTPTRKRTGASDGGNGSDSDSGGRRTQRTQLVHRPAKKSSSTASGPSIA
jgi:hypothetical protein